MTDNADLIRRARVQVRRTNAGPADTRRVLTDLADALERSEADLRQADDEGHAYLTRANRAEAQVQAVRALAEDVGNEHTGPTYVGCHEVLAALDTGSDQ